jgi:hypothetical protein
MGSQYGPRTTEAFDIQYMFVTIILKRKEVGPIGPQYYSHCALVQMASSQSKPYCEVRAG